MARARNIKPGFFKNELLVEMSAFDRLLFIGLWCLADREGRIEDRPKRIKMELFPCDTYDVEFGLVELSKCGFITRYSADTKSVISIANFHKHQTPHGTEKDSELPDENGDLTVNNRDQRGYVSGKKRGINVKNIEISEVLTVNPPLDTGVLTVNPPLDNALNPDSLNPDSLNPESNTSRGKLATRAKKPAPKKTPMPDDFGISDRVQAWAAKSGFSKLSEHLDAFKRKVAANGYEYASWDDAFMEAIRGDWAKLRNGSKGAPDTGNWAAKPAWVVEAGFEDVADANSSRCYEHNAAQFQNGKRLEAA